MIVSALITLREGLEAALVVGIVLGILRKLGRADRSKPVWAGVLSAVIVSIVAALALNAFGVVLEGPSEEAFEGVMMLLAAGVLTWMIFWMQAQGRQIQTDLESDVRHAVSAGSTWALFGLSFVAVVREGVETVLFLSAAASGATSSEVLIGGAVGLVVAVALGWIMFVAGRRLNVRVFFRVTGFLLVLFAAGLAAGGVHELQEAGFLPIVLEHVWDVNHILNERGTLGLFLKALFGYNGNPSLLEVVAYGVYFILIGVLSRQQRRTVVPVEDGL